MLRRIFVPRGVRGNALQISVLAAFPVCISGRVWVHQRSWGNGSSSPALWKSLYRNGIVSSLNALQNFPEEPFGCDVFSVGKIFNDNVNFFNIFIQPFRLFVSSFL